MSDTFSTIGKWTYRSSGRTTPDPRVIALVGALHRYGKHDHNCPSAHRRMGAQYTDGTVACTCGLAAALAAKEEVDA